MATRRGDNKATRIELVGAQVDFSMSDPGFTEITRRLEHYNTASKDFSPVFEAFAEYHKRSIDRNFRAQGRPKRWHRLKPATIRDRLRQGYAAGPILKRSGRLMRSFMYRWNAQQYFAWNTRPYFKAHQYGYPPNNLPARQMLVLLHQDQAQFTTLARKHLGIEA